MDYQRALDKLGTLICDQDPEIAKLRKAIAREWNYVPARDLAIGHYELRRAKAILNYIKENFNNEERDQGDQA